MDKIIRATAGDGFIKMAVISATETVERARAIHNCSPTASAALGRTLCAASLMGQAQKEENATLTIRINGGGPIGSVVAVSDCDGNVRGYVEDPSVDLPLRSDGKLNVGGAVGRDGMLTVSRDLGMRHRAGIGVSESTDAVVVIVSEETGSISVALGGMLKRHLKPETLDQLLRNELIPQPEEENTKSRFALLDLLRARRKEEQNGEE